MQTIELFSLKNKQALYPQNDDCECKKEKTNQLWFQTFVNHF